MKKKIIKKKKKEIRLQVIDKNINYISNKLGLIPYKEYDGKNKIYHTSGWYINGFKCLEKEIAWKTFNEDLKEKLFWLKGYKYWRLKPELLTINDFDSKETEYVVRARIICSIKKMDGYEEIKKI